MQTAHSGAGFDFEIAEQRPGFVALRIIGAPASAMWRDEPGGHRWQRVPPNERRGRVHTSTVTVAVLREPEPTELIVPERELEYRTCRGSGAGGQHRNKTDSAVQLTHLPTGLVVRCESERSQHRNKATALATLRARLLAQRNGEAAARAADARRSQVGSGMRGDKRRTIRCQDGQVHDHITGRRWRLADYLRGEW